jgi:4-amino-4-deoxy-L-arabinose transferase-like glycosyltransferase
LNLIRLTPAKGQDHMQRSLYLAKLIGPVMIAIGLSVLLNGAAFRTLAEQFLHSYALIFLAGVLTLVAGLALVLAHNLWVGDWRVIITIFGWLTVIGGVIRVVLPQQVEAIGVRMFEYPPAPIAAGTFMLVIGAVLSYFGYFASPGAAAPRGRREPAKRRR